MGDHELHASQPAGSEVLQERGPEGAVLAVTDVDPEHFSVPGRGHAGGDHHGPRDDAAADAALEVGGVEEHIDEPGVVQRPVAERLQVPVELGADAADLALADAGRDTERLHEVVDLAGADAVHVGLHHHREQRPVDAAAALEQRREEAALTELGDLQLHVPSRRGQQPRAAPVPLVRATLGPLERRRADERGRLRLDQLLEDPLQRRTDGVGHLAGLERGEQFGQVRLGEGHRRFSFVIPAGTRRRSRRWPTSVVDPHPPTPRPGTSPGVVHSLRLAREP
jgi:hypothetical protein